MKKVAIIIPARYGSARFPGKPLHLIGDKPLILHVIDRVKGSRVSDIIVTTDDERIRDVVESRTNCKVVMTNSEFNCGTDRIAAVAEDIDTDYVLNVQGDQLIPGPEMIDEIIALATPDLRIATLYTDLTSAKEIADPNTIKVLINRLGKIIYMSRSMIPFRRDQYNRHWRYYKQVGIYLFDRLALIDFQKLLKTEIEMIEGIELLRALDHGLPLNGIYTDRPTADVNVPEDVVIAEKYIRNYDLH
jgi:3-deoxy-manno-octulosonate cytidylyltransferase (CMP-KDO synthetase)